MRVLSIQQPWAQLVVRGLRTIDVRTYTKNVRGRIAIHASGAMPSKDIAHEWERDEKTARVFAEMGWRGRNDLRTLPRSAVVGTVEVRGIFLGKDLHRENARQIPRFDFNEALYAALGRVGGGFGWSQRRVEPAPVVIPDDQYAWIFARPIAIEPLEIPGHQQLWTLPPDVAKEVAAREARTRVGEWRPPRVDEAKRRRAKADWERAWSKVYDDLAWKIVLEATWEMELREMQFPDPDYEAAFRQAVTRWIDAHGVAVPGAGLHVRLEPRLRPLFEGREIVRALEFEATLRRYVREQAKADADYARVMGYHERVLEVIRDLKARAARRPVSNAEIVKRAKDAFVQEFEMTFSEVLRDHGLEPRRELRD